MNKIRSGVEGIDRKTKIAWCVFTAVAVIMAAAAIILFGAGERIVSVLEHEGETSLSRQNKRFDIFDGLRIENGDTVYTGERGSVTMSVDENKFVRLGESSQATFEEIVGGKSEQITVIYLETGTLVNDIREKLTNNSSYEISTPNATVSVRGTYFVVYVGEEDGYEGIITRVNVYDGVVEVVNQNGEVAILYADKSSEDRSDSSATILQGNRAVVGKEKIVINKGVDFTGLNRKDLERLKEIAGAEGAVFTIEELDKIIQELFGDKDLQAGNGYNSEGGHTGNSGKGYYSEESETRRDNNEPEVEENPKDSDFIPEHFSQDKVEIEDVLKDLNDILENAEPTEQVKKEETLIAKSKKKGSASGSNKSETSGENTEESSEVNTEESSEANTEESSEANTEEFSQPPNEDIVYEDAVIKVTNRDELIVTITELENKIALLKEIATPEQDTDIRAYEESIQKAKKLLDDVEQVNSVLMMLNTLPMPNEVTDMDRQQIEAARHAYNVLTQEQKALIPARSIEKLEACEK